MQVAADFFQVNIRNTAPLARLAGITSTPMMMVVVARIKEIRQG
jgi:hypothetical protein